MAPPELESALLIGCGELGFPLVPEFPWLCLEPPEGDELDDDEPDDDELELDALEPDESPPLLWPGAWSELPWLLLVDEVLDGSDEDEPLLPESELDDDELPSDELDDELESDEDESEGGGSFFACPGEEWLELLVSELVGAIPIGTWVEPDAASELSGERGVA